MGNYTRKNGFAATRPVEDGNPTARYSGMVTRGKALTKKNFVELDSAVQGVNIVGFKRNRKKFSSREAEIFVHGASGFYSPYELFALHMKATIDRANQVNPVRQYPDRTGEVHNLKDADQQLRSIAAIFVKKYRFVSPTISIYYAALRKRELSLEEAREVISSVSRLGAEQKDKAMLEWLNVLDNGGEDARGLRDQDVDSEDTNGES